MKITGIALKNVIVSAAILSASFMFSLLIQNLFSDQSLIPALFVLAVFLISLITGSCMRYSIILYKRAGGEFCFYVSVF